MIHASRLPIVLCCAEESEVALVAVIDALHREGHAPEVVPGVETDASLVTAATDRVRGPALFVLCQSDDLDRFQVRRLEGLFSARKGPAHRMITVEVARRSTAAIVSEVRAAARELARGAGGHDEDDGRYMRDVVLPTSVAAVPGATVPARSSVARDRAAGRAGPSSALAQAPEGISDEALGLGEARSRESDTEVIDPVELHRRSPPPEPDVPLSTDPAARAALEAAGWSSDAESSDGVPLAVPDDFPVVGESSPDVEVRGVPRRASWDQSGPVEVERFARRSKADPRAEADDRPLPSGSSPIELERPAAGRPVVEAGPPARRGARILLLLVAGAGMGAVITMAVLHATAPLHGGPSDVRERGVPSGPVAPPVTESAPSDAAERAPPSPEPPPTPAASAGEPPDAAPSGATDDADTGGGSGDGSTGGEPDAATRGDASTGAEASESSGTGDGADLEGGAVVGPGDGGTKLVPPPPTKSPGAAAGDGSLAAAIAEGRVRELGTLLVINTGPSTMTWDDAAGRCSGRKVGGLRNWRLPTKGQLGELRRAKLLAPGTYWSRSTVGEDEAFVVDARSGEASQWLKMEPNGRVVCVRARPS